MNIYMRPSGKNWRQIRFKKQIVNGFEVPYIKEDPLKGTSIRYLKSKKLLAKHFDFRSSLKLSHSWKDHWPSQATFNRNLVPLPLYQGFVKQKKKNTFIPPPESKGNLELLKVPNFLHLTPSHIESQCQLIKRELCTYLPDKPELKKAIAEDLPIDLETKDFVFDSANTFHEGSREAVLTVNIDKLKLKSHEKLKLIHLLKENFDEKTGKVTIAAKKCPLRQQNIDYCFYLLYVLYFESKKVYNWESEVVMEDLPEYDWEKGNSKLHLKKVESTISEKEILKNVKQTEALYKSSVKKLNDKPASKQAENEYKESVKKMIGIC